jgi:hypothetical protein
MNLDLFEVSGSSGYKLDCSGCPTAGSVVAALCLPWVGYRSQPASGTRRAPDAQAIKVLVNAAGATFVAPDQCPD